MSEDISKLLRDPVKYLYVVTKARQDPIFFIKHILGSSPYPKQEEIIKKFYERDEHGNPKYRKLIWCSGMRSGKSRCSAWIAAYEFFKLCTLRDPATHYGLDKGSRITINILATSTETADDAIFGQLKFMLKNSDLFNEIIPNIEYRKDFILCEEKNIKCQLLSSWTTTGVGRTAKLVVFDEISYFEETSGKRGAWEVYTRLSKATDTLGIHGRVVAISSPKHPNDIIMTLIRDLKDDPHSLCIVTPTWEVNPNLTFEQLWEANKHNPSAFWRDYGCKPTLSSALQFPNGVKLDKDIANKALVNDMVDHTYLRVMAIDPAVKNDAFGIAFGYIDESGTIIIDGANRFQRLEEQPFISPREIKEHLEDYIRRYNIIAVVFDTWMYPELLEWMSEELGLIIQQHIVKKEDYDRLKELMDAEQVRICDYDVLRDELESLIVINDKRVDHPYGKCFTGDTRVALLDGTMPTFEELADRFGKNEVFYVYSVAPTGEIVVGEARNPRVTHVADEILEIVLDNYQVIRCTLDHPFLTIDGKYIPAIDLTPDIPLFPLYRSVCRKGGWVGYERLWQPYLNKRELVHHMVARSIGLIESEIPEEYIIHHKDGNKRNSIPDNLELIPRSEHARRHATVRYYTDKEFAMKFRSACLQYVKSDRGRQISRETILKNMSKVLAARKPAQKNHRIISKRIIKGEFEMWDITVEPYHNFALNAGVFVHNSKDVADCVANVVWFLTSEEHGGQLGVIPFDSSLVKVL